MFGCTKAAVFFLLILIALVSLFSSSAKAQMRMQPFWKGGQRMHRLKIGKKMEHDPSTVPVMLGGARLQPH